MTNRAGMTLQRAEALLAESMAMVVQARRENRGVWAEAYRGRAASLEKLIARIKLEQPDPSIFVSK